MTAVQRLMLIPQMETQKHIGIRINLNLAMLASWLIACAIPGSGAFAQSRVLARFPESLPQHSGVRVAAYDGKGHKPAAHYEALCRVVHQEFGLVSDSISVNLVFVDSTLMKSVVENNPARFHNSEWQGAFIKPFLIIMLGEEESDDTFMHEYMHALQVRGLLFADVHPSVVHQIIYVNEGLLLGSRSYLQYLKSRR